MIDDKLYRYYVDWLQECIEDDKSMDDTRTKYAVGNRKPSKGVTACFTAAFRGYICEDSKKRMLVGLSKELYLYNGQIYVRIANPKMVLEEMFRRVLRAIGASPVYQEYSSGQIAERIMKTLSCSDEYLFEPNRRYLAFANGILDTGNGGKPKLLDFDMRFKTDLVFDYDYIDHDSAQIHSVVGKENAQKYDLWFKKLDEILPDKDAQKCFQEVCGSIFADRKKYRTEYMGILVGQGSNGKSVLVNSIANAIGNQYVSRYTLQQLFSSNQRDRYIADLNGKLMNLCDDMDTSRIKDDGKMKKFISGDELQGMKAYAPEPVKVAAPPLIGCSNVRPETQDDTWGHHRRMLTIATTNVRFDADTGRDPMLSAKLSETPCKQAIINWLLVGLRRFINNNGEIALPPSVQESMEQTIDESTAARRWLKESGYLKKKEMTAGGNARWIPLKQLFAEYSRYCHDAGESDFERGNDRKLAKSLRSAGYDCKVDRKLSTVFLMEMRQ